MFHPPDIKFGDGDDSDHGGDDDGDHGNGDDNGEGGLQLTGVSNNEAIVQQPARAQVFPSISQYYWKHSQYSASIGIV